jgi:DNA-binding CsgD family transcriptional regulator
VTPSTRELLCGAGQVCTEARWLHAWWFGEPAPVGSRPAAGPALVPVADPLVTRAEVRLASVTVRGDAGGWAVPRPPDDQLLAAGSVGDLVTIFQTVMGERYGPPASGVLAAYRRLLSGYAGGDWSAALSAARAVELTGPPSTVAHQAARLFAAEIYAERGEERRAANWLAAVPVEPPYLAMRAWVACGLGGEEMLTEGRRAYESQRQHGIRLGIEQLLARLVDLAVRSGDQDQADWLLSEVDRHDRDPYARITPETALLVRALARRDETAAEASADLARQRGHRPAELHVCLCMAGLVPEPERWLHRAYEVGRRVDSPHLQSRINTALREHQVAVPRARTAKEPFSPVELTIVDLIRAGHTNRQVALALRMSEKTVENYLTRLFARTGCRSRVELATANLSAIAS